MTNREQLATQKIYPTINNDDLLEFRIPPNSKGQLDLRNVMLHLITSIPTMTDDANVIVPQNWCKTIFKCGNKSKWRIRNTKILFK